MDYGIVSKILGIILMLESLMMVPSLFISVYNRQSDTLAFIISIVLISTIGFIMYKKNASSKIIKAKEGLAIVALGWLLVSFLGSLPFVISGSIPSLVDAFFETVSGFTTTGSTVIKDIEVLPKGILFWRSFTIWIGGMGILVFTVAILPLLGVGGFQIFKAESPGPVKDKIVPRTKDTAKILYITYIAITLLEIVLLMFGGMPLYDACIHTFGTVGTGGFSSKNASIGAYNSTYIQLVISLFMILSGVNFSLYFAIYKGKLKETLKNKELQFYIGLILVSVILISLNLRFTSYNNMGLSVRDSLFQTSSIITTTGYTTVDFDKWPTFSKSILFLLMFIGGCAGSTSGGMKSIRIVVLLKLVKRQIAKIFHPRAIIPVKMNGKSVPSDTIASITSFSVLYFFIFAIGTIIISIENIGLESAASAVATTLGNVGPGFGFVGPTQNFSGFSDFSTLFMSFLMLLGRLELFTILALIAPKAWKNEV